MFIMIFHEIHWSFGMSGVTGMSRCDVGKSIEEPPAGKLEALNPKL